MFGVVKIGLETSGPSALLNLAEREAESFCAEAETQCSSTYKMPEIAPPKTLTLVLPLAKKALRLALAEPNSFKQAVSLWFNGTQFSITYKMPEIAPPKTLTLVLPLAKKALRLALAEVRFLLQRMFFIVLKFDC